MTRITLASHCRRQPVGDEIIIDLGFSRIRRWGLAVYLPPVIMRTAVVLVASRRLLTREEIVEEVYGDRDDGGPLYADGAIKIYTAALKRALAPLGIVLETPRRFKEARILDRPASDAEFAATTLTLGGHHVRRGLSVRQMATGEAA